MRNACKQFTQLALAFTIFAACAALADAQTRDPRLVSARAGGVNLTSGDVTVRRAGQQSWQTLLRADDLRDGDTVRTGPDSRAEILLNPGSYLRLGEQTELQMTDTSLNTVRLRVARGSALVEAFIPDGDSPQAAAPASLPPTATVIEAAARDSAHFAILIDTPRTQALIVRSGVYRVNVAADGSTEFVVRSGRALVGRDAVVVKDGRVATADAGGAVEVAKFDTKQKDELDLWGKKRAEELARANSRLQARALNSLFSNMSWNNFNWGYNPTGFWYWDTGASFYTYIPFFGCRSPYGYYYYTAAPGLLRYCNCNGGFDYRPNPYLYAHRNNGGATRPPNGGGSVVTNGGGLTTNGGGTTNRGGTTGGGTVTGGGSTLGGGSTVSRPPGETPAPAIQHGGGSGHGIQPPL